LIYSYFDTKTIAETIAVLSKKERKLVTNSAILYAGRILKLEGNKVRKYPKELLVFFEKIEVNLKHISFMCLI
jgi:hypothetical protein